MTIETQIARLQSLATAELAAEYTLRFGASPRSRNNAWMRKRLAFRIQQDAYGGLPSVARAALERLRAEIELPAAPRVETTNELRVGTLLQREWHGTQIRVLVTADGFEWNGTRYGSLSAVAFAITGAKWNGKLFFGLVERKRA